MSSARLPALILASLLLACSSSQVDQPLVPASLSFDTQPPASVVSARMLGSIRVAVLTSDGQLATDAAGTVTVGLVSSDTSAHLAGATSARVTLGVATFNDLSVARTGTGFRLVARMTGVADATSSAFSVTTPPAAQAKFAARGQPGVRPTS